MKRKLMILMFSLLIFMGFATVSYAKDSVAERPDIKIIIDGEMVSAGTPIVMNGRTLLPLRDLLTSLGVENDDQHIVWNGFDHSVTAIKDSTTIYLKVGTLSAAVNGQSCSIDAAPVNYKGKVYIPARFAAEAFAKNVYWDSDYKIIYIRDKVQFNQIKSILNQSMKQFDETSNYKVSIVDDGVSISDNGNSDTYNISSDFRKVGNTAYSMRVDTFDTIDNASGKDQVAYETFQCNNQFIYFRDSLDANWQKLILSTNYNIYLNSNNPNNILPDADFLYASLVMEEDQKNHLIHFRQDPYLNAYMDNMNFRSPTNQSYYAYDITIDSQSGYIVKISKREKINADNIWLSDNTSAYNYYDINKNFNIDMPEQIKSNLQKTILPDKLSISSEERKTIDVLKKAAVYHATDFHTDGPRYYESNAGALICSFEDQKSLDTYYNMSDNAKIIFCNEIAKEYRDVFTLCDGVFVAVDYNGNVYTEMVTGYDYLLNGIEHDNGMCDTKTILYYIEYGYRSYL